MDDDYADSKEKTIGAAFREYLNNKKEYLVGNHPRDLIQQFIEDEMTEFLRFRQYNSVF